MTGYPPPPPPPPPPPMPPMPPGGAQGWSPVEVYGSWITRVGGYVIDQLVALPGWIIYGIGFAVAGLGSIDPVTGVQRPANGIGVFLIVVGGLVALGINVWNRWFRAGRTGQSVGRQVMGLTLISEQTGQPIGAGLAFVRDLAHVVDQITCYIGWLFPLWDAKRQTLADKIMGTVVLNVPK